jgi:hypothetical protein
MLKTHVMDKSFATEKLDSKPICITADELLTSVRPAEDSAEQRILEKEKGFNYLQVLAELALACVSQIDQEDELKYYECHVNSVSPGTFDSGSCTVRPVTSKHNIADTESKGVLEIFQKQGYSETILCAFQEPATTTIITVDTTSTSLWQT